MANAFTPSRPGNMKGPSGGKVKSPSNTPQEEIQTLGGMPSEKSIKQINDANDPVKRGPAPGAVHGV